MHKVNGYTKLLLHCLPEELDPLLLGVMLLLHLIHFTKCLSGNSHETMQMWHFCFELLQHVQFGLLASPDRTAVFVCVPLKKNLFHTFLTLSSPW